MTVRSMQDAVTPSNIDPAAVQLVAGYLNGRYAWSAADWARFPAEIHVGISVRADYLGGHVLDVEPGDATPAQAVGWVLARRSAGADPTVYCNASTWPSVRSAFRAAGVPEPHYWIAKYDGDPTIPAGAVAKQYRGDVAPGIDVSSVADYWPGVDPAPIPTTAGEDMPDRELKPSPNGSVTLTVPTDASQLVISLGWTSLTATKVAFFGATPATGVDQIKSYGSQRVDAGRPYVLPVPAGALTAEVDYVLAPMPGRDVTGTAGFRK